MFISDPSLEKLTHVKHAFFTKNGGVSKDVFASLNCNFRGGDEDEVVKKNREAAMKKLGLKPDSLCTLKQIHSDIALSIIDPYEPGLSPEADGLVTDRENITLGILTADCAPVLFADKNKKIIGACHSGWRGARYGILEKTTAAMQRLGASLDSIVASVGPCIGESSYEVGPEFYDNFIKESVNNKEFFKKSKRAGHYLFDLPGYIEHKLNKIGIGAISLTRRDTLKEKNNFFSYRRNSLSNIKQYGCQLSVISLI